MLIIDAHTHVHDRANGLGDLHDASVETLIEAIHAGPLHQAVVLPIAPLMSNEFIADICKAHPNELIGFASVEPLKGWRAVSQLEEAVVQLGLKGLKIHPRIQGFGHEDVATIVPLVQKSADLNIPVLIDALPYGRDYFRARTVSMINDLATAVPKARLIMAHAGGHELFDALVVAKANRNVFLDLAYTLLYYRGSSVEKDLGFLIRKLGAERFIYGSDHPEYPAKAALEESMEVLEQFKLKERDLESIMGNNMAGLLS